jgi:hypothetical protein
MNQADAHFAGWLLCPVCKKATRHYTKDTHDILSRRCVEFGLRIAVWFRCNLSKPAENGSKLNRKLAVNQFFFLNFITLLQMDNHEYSPFTLNSLSVYVS